MEGNQEDITRKEAEAASETADRTNAKTRDSDAEYTVR